MLVSDILARKGYDVVITRPHVSIVDVARLFRRKRIGSAVVLETDGGIAGLISERDIVDHIAEGGERVVTSMAGDVMSKNVVTCSPDSEIVSVMKTMTSHRVRHVPVLKQGELAGIVSIGDIVKYRLEENALEINVLRDVARAHTIP